MYTQKEYMEKAEEANRKNQQLYIFGTGELTRTELSTASLL